ncbi:hypothetical protein EDD85DRAFT_961509 [Armillaria nabsnona]|nr:hypothetical protein EDD85DRAFT_961509 [Armillaria nabsnona]
MRAAVGSLPSLDAFCSSSHPPITLLSPLLVVAMLVANLVEAFSIPYVEKLAGVPVAIIELLQKKGKNKEDLKDFPKGIANTIAVIQTHVCLHGERGAAYSKDIWAEMEGLVTAFVCYISHTANGQATDISPA